VPKIVFNAPNLDKLRNRRLRKIFFIEGRQGKGTAEMGLKSRGIFSSESHTLCGYQTPRYSCTFTIILIHIIGFVFKREMNLNISISASYKQTA